MGEMNIRLASPFTLLKQAWSLALKRSNIVTYLVLGAIPQVLSFGLATLVAYFLNNTTNAETTIINKIIDTLSTNTLLGIIIVLILIFVLLVVMPLLALWYTALLYKIYQATTTNTINRLTTYFGPARQVTFRLFTTYVKVGLITLFGFLFFIIPGIIFSIRYLFAPLIASTEDSSINPSEESKKLAMGRSGKLALRSLLPFFIYSISLSIFQSIHPLLGAVWSISSPIFGLYFYLVYLDFKRTAPATA